MKNIWTIIGIFGLVFLAHMFLQWRMISGAIGPNQFFKVCYLSGGKYMIMHPADSTIYMCGFK